MALDNLMPSCKGELIQCSYKLEVLVKFKSSLYFKKPLKI